MERPQQPKGDPQIMDEILTNYSIVDHMERLPERLPAVFAALTG